MSPYIIIQTIFIIVSIQTTLSQATQPEYTFNTLFNWQPYSPSYEVPNIHTKPIMIVFYGENCFASSRFKKQITNSKEIIQLSEELTMVKIERREDPGLSRYRKNGMYYPRVYFIDTNGALLKGINGPDNEHKYYFGTADELLEAMNTILSLCFKQQEIYDLFHEEF